MEKNIVWHSQSISKEDRENLNGHKGICIWLTGLSGSGKSTIANELDSLLHSKRIHTYILDGDNIRHGLNKDLGFSPSERSENIRRIGEVARLFTDAGMVVITAFISPYIKDRNSVRELLKENFIEVYVDCDLKICEERDPKNLYKKARENKVDNFTGITDPYEKPLHPELIINTEKTAPAENAKQIISYLITKKIIPG